MKLPPDPCRMLGGKRKTKRQNKPVAIFDQVSTQQFNKRLRLQGANHKRKYHSTKIREFMADGRWDRRHAPGVQGSIGGLAFRFYS